MCIFAIENIDFCEWKRGFVFKLFTPNGIPQPYKLDALFSILRIIGWIFPHFILISIEYFVCEQWRPSSDAHDLQRLVCVCTICQYPTKNRDFFRFIIVNVMCFEFDNVYRLTG